MATTQPPYHDTIFGAPNQDPSSTTPTGTYLNSNTIEAGTGTDNTNPSLSSDHHAETSTSPHRSSLLNKLDPRVDTHSTHQQTSTIPSQQTHGNMVGSSTGASGGAPGVSNSSQYDPSMTGYNPSTGSGYNTAQSGEGASKSATTAQGAGSSMGKKGDEVGQGAKNIYSGIHGAGESLRGALNGAVDRAFGSGEGIEKNQAIAQKGEEEIKSGSRLSK